MTVETEVNGTQRVQMKGVLPFVGLVVPVTCLGCPSQPSTKYFFPHRALFQFIVMLGRISLNMCLWFHARLRFSFSSLLLLFFTLPFIPFISTMWLYQDIPFKPLLLTRPRPNAPCSNMQRADDICVVSTRAAGQLYIPRTGLPELSLHLLMSSPPNPQYQLIPLFAACSTPHID
jgi:hypothetical protein